MCSPSGRKRRKDCLASPIEITVFEKVVGIVDKNEHSPNTKARRLVPKHMLLKTQVKS